ncbi:MAG: pitrilysin family protein [Candidatus Omnitrophica bacterium]|nr:pitrilysin family protein [Candidatus Omnitrophota bacterium]
MYKFKTLDNGARFTAREIPDRDSIAIGIWLNVGARYEPKAVSGVSHFLEHLLFKGTKKRTNDDIKEAIEGRGGAMNGFTSEEFTCYLVKVLSRDMDTALDILSDMVLNAKLDPGDIKKEKTVIKEEIKLYMDLPNHHVQDMLMELLWPDQPLGRNLAGTVKTVSDMKRKDIYGYKNKYYNPANIIVSAAGNLDADRFFSSCEKYLDAARIGPKSSYKNASEAQKKPNLRVLSKTTEQAHLAIGVRAFGRGDPDKYALTLLNIILGGNMSSRLFRELREKRGLAYEINTHTKRLNDTGAFLVSAGLDNKNVIRSTELIMKELKKIKEKAVGNDEFGRAREFYKGQLLLGLEDTLDQMLWMGEHLSAEGKIPTPQEVVAEIEKITPDDVRRVAKRIFGDRHLNMAVIGTADKSEEKNISEVLHIG